MESPQPILAVLSFSPVLPVRLFLRLSCATLYLFPPVFPLSSMVNRCFLIPPLTLEFIPACPAACLLEGEVQARAMTYENAVPVPTPWDSP